MGTLLGDFMLDWMQKRGMSQDDLGVEMGFGERRHDKISRAIGSKTPPTWKFLEKLSEVTGEDILDLAARALGREPRISPTSKLLVRIVELTQDNQDLYDLLILGLEHADDKAFIQSIVTIMKGYSSPKANSGSR